MIPRPRTAKTRHTRRAKPYGTPAAQLIVAVRRAERGDFPDHTAPLLLPGLRPVLAAR